MNTRRLIVASTALVTAISFAAPQAAEAQRRSGPPQQQQQQGSRGGGGQRQAPPPSAQPAPRSQPQSQSPRGGQVQRSAPPQQQRQAPPPPQAVPRRGVPQTTQRYAPPQTRYNAPPRSTFVAPRYSAHNYQYRRPVFSQPYFAFRPRFSIGFGVNLGYSVRYPFQYYDGRGFYNFGLNVLPGWNYGNYSSYYNRIGGVTFDIDPYDAEIYVDGQYAGYAADFSAGQMPLTLTSGRHRIDLRAPGLRTVSFDVNVIAGEVIPYQGTMSYR